MTDCKHLESCHVKKISGACTCICLIGREKLSSEDNANLWQQIQNGEATKLFPGILVFARSLWDGSLTKTVLQWHWKELCCYQYASLFLFFFSFAHWKSDLKRWADEHDLCNKILEDNHGTVFTIYKRDVKTWSLRCTNTDNDLYDVVGNFLCTVLNLVKWIGHYSKYFIDILKHVWRGSLSTLMPVN